MEQRSNMENGTGGDAVPVVPRARPDDVAFRGAMAKFASGVTVVTAVDRTGQPHGATVNSFVSVSLDPPTVLVSLARGRTAELIAASGAYGVSVLRHDQQAYSRHFSGHPDARLSPGFVMHDHVPTLAGSLAWFECCVVRSIAVCDHTLFIARVTCCGVAPGVPLLYFAHRQFDEGRVGEP